jgi:lipid-binding SYLF domain-containing protein
MAASSRRREPSRISAGALAGALALTILASVAAPVRADDAMETKQLVEKARLTFESLIAAPEMNGLRDLAKRAKGIFIAPQILRGAFIVGVSGGSGVLLARGETAGQWGGPAFYTMGEASFGLQAGGDASELVLLIMTDRGVAALLSSSVKLGVDASIAAGPVGVGVTAATANLSADIISFSRSKGLYGGVSLEGAVVATRGSWNAAYYGKEVTPTEILIRRTVSNPQATGLIQEVARAGEAR